MLRKAISTAQRYLLYGAMLGLVTASVTWSLLLGLQVWVISSVALYLVFCAAYNAVAVFEIHMENATSAALVEMRQRSINALRQPSLDRQDEEQQKGSEGLN